MSMRYLVLFMSTGDSCHLPSSVPIICLPCLDVDKRVFRVINQYILRLPPFPCHPDVFCLDPGCVFFNSALDWIAGVPSTGLQEWYTDFDGWVCKHANGVTSRLIQLQQRNSEIRPNTINSFYLQNAMNEGIFPIIDDTKKTNDNLLRHLKNNTRSYVHFKNGTITLNGNVVKYSCIYSRSKLFYVVLFLPLVLMATS
ncbi:uncharacterized protein LOC131840817 [Achroia grisella]|uniref:uncharacterized protein LOC131840817 n=1 Tax=Achroia grisella TaxID=688607 RepID=UPI0027D3108D|nr:uncharacterized protein LOC131840817 [Achroia grisella]